MATRERPDAAGPADPNGLDAVVGALVDEVVAELRDTEGRVHLDTALAGAGAMAGALLLRATLGEALDSMEPGQLVLVEGLDGRGSELFALAASAAAARQLPWTPTATIPPGSGPQEPEAELVRRLEPPYLRVLDDAGVPEDLWPGLAALAAVRLLELGAAAIDPEVGSAIVAGAIVTASRTVPYPSEA